MLKAFLRTAICAAVMASAGAMAKTPVIITSIKPVQSLIAQITDGVTEPQLLIKEGSPHGYQLKPSDVRAIAGADLAVWTSNDLETVLPAAVKKAGVAHVIVWEKVPNIELLKSRSGGMWDEHDPDSGFTHADGGHHHHDHHHGEYNPHLWLSTKSAAALVTEAAKQLSEIDPDNQAKYEKNLQKTLAALEKQHAELAEKLKPYGNSPFMVFHDAYPYFEQEFGLHPVGVVRADPEHEPGAARIAELRKVFQENRIQCVFNEPQFPSKLAAKLAADTAVKQAVLDPVGADIPAGPEMYGKLMNNLAENLAGCLTPN